MAMNIGDWVLGRTKQGELIHGYVNQVHELQGAVGIYVVDSDRQEAIGQMIDLDQRAVRTLPLSTYESEDQIRSLIDVALTVRDKAWFGELADRLSAMQAEPYERRHFPEPTAVERNRIGLIYRD